MTIDERIEALTQIVELLSQFHQDNEKTYAAMFARLDASIARIDGTLERLLGVSERLADIAQDHDHRIRRLEDNGQS